MNKAQEEVAKERVSEMIGKARSSSDSNDALKWSQAALNAANAIAVLANLKK